MLCFNDFPERPAIFKGNGGRVDPVEGGGLEGWERGEPTVGINCKIKD